MACWGAVVDGCVVVVSLWWMDMSRWQLTCVVVVVVMEGWCCRVEVGERCGSSDGYSGVDMAML